MAGALIQWLRDGLGLIASAAAITPLAESVPDNHGVVVVPAHAGLGAPYWQPNARGSIQGLTRGSTRAHIARATLEAIALQVDDLLSAMLEDCKSLPDLPSEPPPLRVDGGVTKSRLLLQLQADLLQAELLCSEELDATARGVAWMAGQTFGLWTDLETTSLQAHSIDAFLPIRDFASLSVLRTQWRSAMPAIPSDPRDLP